MFLEVLRQAPETKISVSELIADLFRASTHHSLAFLTSLKQRGQIQVENYLVILLGCRRCFFEFFDSLLRQKYQYPS
jgi:hypothetical protein